MSGFSSPGLKSKIGSFTRDMTAASGSQAVTGVGFTPTSIYFTASINGTSLGCDGVVDSTAAGLSIATNGVAMVRNLAGSVALFIPGDNVIATSQSAIVASFDADGFTLTWTKGGAPGANTATVYFHAHR